MITRGLREFVARDWLASRRAKDLYWADRIARLGAIEGFRVADELRRQALLVDPSWPHPDDRRKDLEAHILLAGVFRRVDAAGGR